MTPQQEEAIKKIDEEFEKKHNEYQYQFMSEAIIGCVSNNPEMAAPVLEKGKTMKNAWQKVWEYARAHQSKGGAMLPSEKVKQIVFDYFGISEKSVEVKKPQPLPVAKAENVAEEEPAAKKLELDLDDLLGGL